MGESMLKCSEIKAKPAIPHQGLTFYLHSCVATRLPCLFSFCSISMPGRWALADIIILSCVSETAFSLVPSIQKLISCSPIRTMNIIRCLPHSRKC